MTVGLAILAVIFTIMIALAGTLAVAGARDAIPSKTAARFYVWSQFPAAAPRVLLKDKRANQFHTSSIWVESAKRCKRNVRLTQVECRFTLRMAPDRGVPNQPEIRCRGEVWVRLRDGQLIGRPGDYECVA